MARENQGLQIALIIFVTTTVALGVMSWLFFQKYNETSKKLDVSVKESSKNQQAAEKAQKDNDDLKRLITGQPTAEPFDAVKERFDKDMQTFGATYPTEAQFYRPLMEKLNQSLQEKNGELKLAEEKILKQDTDYQQWKKEKEVQIKTFEEAQKKASTDLVEQTNSFQKRFDEISREKDALQEKLQSTRKELTAEIEKAKQKATDSKLDLDKALKTVKYQGEKLDSVTSTVVDRPDGEVRWVDQKNGLVWINLGRADALKPLQTFAVYPGDITDLTKGKPKGDIEVTQLRREHLAEARITKDEISDPILPGDKIFTPLWNPGEKIHVALAGLIDVDGDGKSDLDLVRHLVAVNDGVVDAYQEDQGKEVGKRVGDLNLGTRYLVLGEEPTEKTSSQFLTERSEMVGKAAEFGIRSIPLKDLLDRMGYRRQAHVVKYGLGADPKDFAVGPENGPKRSSTGSVSEIFKPRQPPRSSGGAY
jgi:hypothetical protein